ncbi:hypothetical protein [Moraxella cuniculi]|nr:hypothetical protein [Moraxella cuniculi]
MNNQQAFWQIKQLSIQVCGKLVQPLLANSPSAKTHLPPCLGLYG